MSTNFTTCIGGEIIDAVMLVVRTISFYLQGTKRLP